MFDWPLAKKVSDHIGKRKTVTAVTKADFKGHSSGLGSFPLANLSHSVGSINANASFGITVAFLMQILFSSILPFILREEKYSHS